MISDEEFNDAVSRLKREQHISELRRGSRHYLKLRSAGKPESAAYQGVLSYLRETWLPQERHGIEGVTRAEACICAKKRGQDGAGNPDLIAVVEVYGEARFDVISFEVKLSDHPISGSLSQANDQRNSVDFAYLVYQLKPEADETTLRKGCEMRGLGLIGFTDADDHASFRSISPARRNPTPLNKRDFVEARADRSVLEVLPETRDAG